MKTLYILSHQPFAGKTLVTIGILNSLMEQGFSVGYIKPIGLTPQKRGESLFDTDAILIKELLNLKDPLEVISPFVVTYETIGYLKEGRLGNIKKKIGDALDSMRDRDFVILGGAGNIFTGSILGIDSLSLLEEFRSKALCVESFSGDPSLDNIAGLRRIIGKRFLGAVINRVPKQALSYVKENIRSYLDAEGIKIFGIFPRDEVLEALSVRDIVSLLNAKVLCGEDRLDELVEHFTVGAMDVDNALKYFRRISNKAVITGCHRSDIQLAAMETSTKVIILTGGTGANDVVIAKAISKGVPLIAVEYDTFTVVDKIEGMLGKSRIKEDRKLQRLKEIFKEEFNMEAFMEAIRV